MPQAAAVPILDLEPPVADVTAEVIAGLSARPQPTLPAKLFYDERGSKLFEEICDLPEYYPTRTEVAILNACRSELADVIGENATIVEFGSGSTRKVRLLLEAVDVAAYVPVDISRWYLEEAASELNRDWPELLVRPVLADYAQEVPLPDDLPDGPRLGFFPGGTIGNFRPHEAVEFLSRVARTLGPGGRLVVGFDLRKDPAVLHAAYNDRAGVTGAFNLNVLRRLNAEVDADFDLAAWHHYAPFVPGLGRIEMHLVAASDQRVHIDGRAFTFERGTSLRTELSHKFTAGGFATLAAEAGFRVERRWTDPSDLFCVALLRVNGS